MRSSAEINFAIIGRKEYGAQPLPAWAYPTFAIIPVKGQHDLTDQLVADLLEQGEAEGIFILYNGADEDPYPNPHGVTVIPAAGLNIGQLWNKGCELVAEGAPRSNIAILNNDLKIGPKFLSRLGLVLRSHPRILAVCPNYDGREGTGFQQVTGIPAGKEDGTGGLAGFAFMIPTEAWTSGAKFDEQFDLWFTDTDYCIQLDRAGAVYGIALDVPVEHIGGGSQTLYRTPEWRARAAVDGEKFKAKWS